jgi:hypothetical protein
VTHLEKILEETCPDLRACNCASCGKLLVTAESKKQHGHQSRGIDTVYATPKLVPFCRSCYSDGEVAFVLRQRNKVRPNGGAA